MKAWLLKKLGVDLEEVRKLRQKCDYQERWIAQRIRAKDAPVVNHAAQSLKVFQRRVDRLMHERPDVFQEYFSKEAPR